MKKRPTEIKSLLNSIIFLIGFLLGIGGFEDDFVIFMTALVIAFGIKAIFILSYKTEDFRNIENEKNPLLYVNFVLFVLNSGLLIYYSYYILFAIIIFIYAVLYAHIEEIKKIQPDDIY